MKKINTYIIEKLKINKDSKITSELKDLIYVVVRNSDLWNIFDEISEIVINQEDFNSFYSCLVSKDKKNKLLKYFDGISCHLITNPEKYSDMSLEEFGEKVHSGKIVGCFNHIGKSYLKNL